LTGIQIQIYYVHGKLLKFPIYFIVSLLSQKVEGEKFFARIELRKICVRIDSPKGVYLHNRMQAKRNLRKISLSSTHLPARQFLFVAVFRRSRTSRTTWRRGTPRLYMRNTSAITSVSVLCRDAMHCVSTQITLCYSQQTLYMRNTPAITSVSVLVGTQCIASLHKLRCVTFRKHHPCKHHPACRDVACGVSTQNVHEYNHRREHRPKSRRGCPKRSFCRCF
jgi:hypothetical protein